MNRYVLVAYKPHSSCYSMGCLMESYDSDLGTHEVSSEEELIALMADYYVRNEFMGHQEEGYGLQVIEGYIKADEIDTCHDDLGVYPKARQLAEPLIAERKMRREQEEKQRERNERRASEREERRELGRLKKKYENGEQKR